MKINSLVLKYLCDDNNKGNIMEKYLVKDDGMTTGSTGITATQGVYEPYKRRKKTKLFRRVIDEKTVFNIEDIIDTLGGDKYFKQKFSNKEQALKYINFKLKDLMKIFSLTQKDIDYNSIEIYLSKLFK